MGGEIKKERRKAAPRLGSVYDKASDLCYQLIGVFRVDGKLDGRKKVQTEDTHNGLSVYYVTAGGEVDLSVKSGNCVYKIANVGNGSQSDIHSFHNNYSFHKCDRFYYSEFFGICQLFCRHLQKILLTLKNICSIMKGR